MKIPFNTAHEVANDPARKKIRVSSQTSKAIYDIIEKQTMLDAEEEAEYDINEMEQMFWWKPDVSTNPTVLDGLTKTYAKMIEVTTAQDLALQIIN